jgi:hypothetical protein
VSAYFDLITMNTKIFGEFGAAVGVRTLADSVCSLVPADRPSSEKSISKDDLWRMTKDDFGWPTDAELDVSELPVLVKNLAKNFMNTFFAERGSRLTLDESVRPSGGEMLDPFVDEGVVPKPEPVEEGVIGPPEYVYLIPDASSDGVAVAKTEQM